MQLLLDAGELHELRSELVGVERIERVLVLQLGGQQRQEGLEIVGESRLDGEPVLAESCGVGRAPKRSVGIVASTAIAFSSNPDIDAAARAEHAAIGAARDDRRSAVFLAQVQAMCVATIPIRRGRPDRMKTGPAG